jgi:hypothetical protein
MGSIMMFNTVLLSLVMVVQQAVDKAHEGKAIK